MGNKILVIGATSKVGTELVKALVAKGEAVKAATRRPAEYPAPAGVEVTAFDFDVPASAKPALVDVDRVFMLSHWTDLHPEMELNSLVERARAAGVQRLVYLTGTGVDKEPVIGISLVEKRIAGSGMGYTFLHPNWLMQNFSRGFLLPTIRDISAIVVPGGFGTISFVDARDVAAVAVAALTDEAHNGQSYHLTGGQALSYGQVADVLTDILDRNVIYQDATDERFREVVADRWEAEQAEYLIRLLRYARAGQSATVEPTLATLLGREPTTFEQFARDHAAVWR